MSSATPIDISDAQILVVDDDAVTRLLLGRIMAKQNFHVREATTGARAVELVEALVPDLILLDVSMGQGMDGFETCVALKKIEGMNDVPVIFVTGHADPESHVKGFESGGRDYLVKPIQQTETLARIRTHLEVRMLLKQQKQYISELRKVNDSKNRLISVASHDLRNPLASVLGYADLIKDKGPLTEDQLAMVETVKSTSQSMLNLVEKLLSKSLSREDGAPIIEREKCCIDEILQSSVNIYRFLANKKGIVLNLIPAKSPPFDLHVDKTQFRRLIDNLVSNAVKYSQPNTEVTIRVDTDADSLTIIVEDEGKGIPEEEIGHLFKDFGKTSVKPTADEPSIGLGLSICREIIEGHSGQIRAENRSDSQGARFIVELGRDRSCD